MVVTKDKSTVDLIKRQEVVDTLDRDVELNEHQETHGKHHERSLQSLKEIQGSENDGGSERLTHHRGVHGEDDERNDVGNDLENDIEANCHQPVGVSHLLQLLLTDLTDLAKKGLLPAVVLDDTNAHEDLIQQLDSLIGVFHIEDSELSGIQTGSDLNDKHHAEHAQSNPGQPTNDGMDEDEGDHQKNGSTDSNEDEQREHLQDGRIRTHDVHNLTSGGVALGGRGEVQCLAVDSLRSHRLHLDTNTNHFHLSNRTKVGIDNGDHQKQDGVGPTKTLSEVLSSLSSLLKISNELLEDKSGNKTEDQGDNEEKDGPNPRQ